MSDWLLALVVGLAFFAVGVFAGWVEPRLQKAERDAEPKADAAND